MQYYISDLHFGHAQSIGFNNRPFNNVEEMDEFMINAWREKVKRTDDVYIIGDICYRNEKPAWWYVEQLTGHLHLVIGNHDRELLKDNRAVGRFVSIEKMMHISDNKRQIHACHFPMAEWNGYYKNAWHVYGHIHNRIDTSAKFMSGFPKALNAGADINGYVPVTLDELISNNNAWRIEISKKKDEVRSYGS